MRIEDIFKNLQNSEMPVSKDAFAKLDKKLKVQNSAPSSIKDTSNITNVAKASSWLTKSIIGVLSAAIITTAAVLVYNNMSNKYDNVSLSVNNTNRESIREIEELDIDSSLNNNSILVAKDDEIKKTITEPIIEFNIMSDSLQQISNSQPDFHIQNIHSYSNIEPIVLPLTKDIKLDTLHTDTTTDLNKPKDIDIKIPNVITPNGDGINDCFVIKGIENYRDNILFIYNSNGKEVYRTTHYQNEFCPLDFNQGAYFYILKLNYEGKHREFKGSLTILR